MKCLHIFSKARVRSQPLVQCGFVGVFLFSVHASQSTFADDLVTKLVEKAGAEMAVQDNLDVKASKADDNSVGAKTDHEQDRHIEQNVEEPFPSERDTNEPENDSATVDDIHSELREQNEETAADMEVDEARPLYLHSVIVGLRRFAWNVLNCLTRTVL